MSSADSNRSDLPRVETSAPSVDGLADPVVIVDPHGLLHYANDMAAEVLGWDPVDLLGSSVLELVHPDDLNLAAAALQTVVTKSVGDLIVLRLRTGHGTWRYLELRGTFRTDDADDPHAGRIVIVARDITERHRLEFDQGDIEVLRSVMANMHGMVVLVDAQSLVRTVNGAVTRILGHDPELVRGRSILDFLHPDDRDQVFGATQSLAPQESVTLDARILKADAEPLVCAFTVTNLLDDPVVASFVISAQIAAALADARERAEFLALHDGRTGLLNRDGFMRAATAMMQSGGGLGILIVDIVHFRSVNELYGEPVGDSVLSTVAERIDKIRWPDLITARFGGDEFVLAVRGPSAGTVEMLRDRVRRDMARPVVIDGQEVNFQIRTAIAYEPKPQVLDALLVSASNDLMSAKRFADPESGGISVDAINQRRRQVDHLRQALNAGEIQPFYQPICTSEGEITAVEALARWVHPLRGVLGAGEILPLAQLAGLAEAVDDCVLDHALEFAVALADLGRSDIEVHINIDPKVIARPAFGASFLDRCHRRGAAPTQLVIEITETDLLSPGAASLANMHKLRFAGIHVSIDDFGTGYSSLAHLLELPIDGVKIDRRFVAGIDVDPAATNLTTAILGLSKSLNLTCVAEGVEQPYQRDRLVELGCRSFQGWLFSAAVASTEIVTMIGSASSSPADQESQRSPL
ncbi:MAG TPA: EAL domain-containing protein [Ilumatobacteraceae bacterium]|nr:EAL domain-containing protein [Ilumatobacteraceae bacterium]